MIEVDLHDGLEGYRAEAMSLPWIDGGSEIFVKSFHPVRITGSRAGSRLALIKLTY
ncbi:MAG: hypothetical protein V3V97_17155 [Hyphomicrobiaceae bacterium]